MHPFTLRQLEYAVAVADELNFRRAAERCHVSQPSLSEQLAQLESMLGVKLFERTHKRVLVTPVGAQLLDRARIVLREAAEIVTAAKLASDPMAGTIRLGIIPTISPYLLPIASPRIRAALPRLRIAWHEDKTEALVKQLAKGEIEGALLALEANIGDVVKDIVATDPFFLVTLPDHPLAKAKTPVRETDLRGQELLLLDDGHCFRDQALEACSHTRVRESEFRATSLTTLVQMVSGGAGITLVPSLAIDTEVARARLHARPLEARSAHRTIALVWRKGASVEPALKRVAAIVRDAYPKPKRHSGSG